MPNNVNILDPGEVVAVPEAAALLLAGGGLGHVADLPLQFPHRCRTDFVPEKVFFFLIFRLEQLYFFLNFLFYSFFPQG